MILSGRLRDRPELRILPVLAMVEIEKVLAAAYPEATFERGRHAVKVDFGPGRCSFDIVPAFETDTDDDDVLIANTETNTWDRSNTRTLIRVIAERNQACDGRFVHQVRMAKQYVVHSLEGLIPGLHVETFAYAAVTGPLEHAEASCRILEAGARLLAGAYTDPTGVDQISRKLKPGVARRPRPRSPKRPAAPGRRSVWLRPATTPVRWPSGTSCSATRFPPRRPSPSPTPSSAPSPAAA